MKTTRLEAFSDGVIAIIITIMVLELKAPHGDDFSDLLELLPSFLSYILSFIYVGIYWNNHHHMLQITQKISGRVLLANLHLLFWLSLFPFTTAWMGENHFSSNPTMVYGFVLLMASIAYFLLQIEIIKAEGKESALNKALGSDWKGKVSIAFYFISILIALFAPRISQLIFIGVALMWFLPDRRIEQIFPKK